ncbi:hypothetical protein SEA_TOMAS_139 [Streptomyces phage Tomas]|uniref:Uncharacterized protein n=1 Tax=Streptomyces phage Tomas TaxID=2914443 RepID=A0AA49BT26_9CAUD|nr:hypothetical protein PP453_gp152 [Streptomyces phage Tomas]UMO76315.1 hypothetical protein SEA_TOMAS_139 [Streptomyces phage Tomas]
MIIILCSIIGALLFVFLLVGTIGEWNETSRMKACVEKSGNWVNAPGGKECRQQLDIQPTPSYSSSNKPR